MANSSALYVRMDPTLKESAEEILSQLGISSSSAVQMFYHQIVLHRGLPFHLQLPDNRPVAIGGMSRTELDREIKRVSTPWRPGHSTLLTMWIRSWQVGRKAQKVESVRIFYGGQDVESMIQLQQDRY